MFQRTETHTALQNAILPHNLLHGFLEDLAYCQTRLWFNYLHIFQFDWSIFQYLPNWQNTIQGDCEGITHPKHSNRIPVSNFMHLFLDLKLGLKEFMLFIHRMLFPFSPMKYRFIFNLQPILEYCMLWHFNCLTPFPISRLLAMSLAISTGYVFAVTYCIKIWLLCLGQGTSSCFLITYK